MPQPCLRDPAHAGTAWRSLQGHQGNRQAGKAGDKRAGVTCAGSSPPRGPPAVRSCPRAGMGCPGQSSPAALGCNSTGTSSASCCSSNSVASWLVGLRQIFRASINIESSYCGNIGNSNIDFVAGSCSCDLLPRSATVELSTYLVSH